MSRLFRFSLTSVPRWLFVVCGCAVLAALQPVTAAEPAPAAEAKRGSGTVLYPQSTVAAPRPADASPSGSFWVAGLFMLTLGGAWLLFKRRQGGLLFLGASSQRKIVIEESRSLGNRQYLVVAGCEGRRFLLGVTQGNIQLLSPLDSETPRS